MKFKNTVLVCSLLLSFFSFAESVPNSAWQDNRVKEVLYDENDVVRIPVKTGTSTLIQFSKGENMLDADKSGLGIGDPLAWDIGVRSNSIFIRPIEDAPDTNMTIITNKRTYLLNLVSSGSPAWKVKFLYPEEEGLSTASSKKDLTPPCMRIPNPNREYLIKGDKELAPYTVWDDGYFTCLKFPNNKSLPLVYKKLKRANEQLVNSHVEGDTLVLHEVYGEYRLRLGDAVLGLKSDKVKEGFYDTRKKTSDDTKRVVNDY